MRIASGLWFRAAGPGDAHAIAGLHADSWQRHYRGARQGIGTRLLALTAQAVVDWSPSSGLYLLTGRP